MRGPPLDIAPSAASAWPPGHVPNPSRHTTADGPGARARASRERVSARGGARDFRVLVLSGGKVPMSADEVARIGRGAGAGEPPDSEAEAMRRLALRLGLDPGAEVVLETEAPRGALRARARGEARARP